MILSLASKIASITNMTPSKVSKAVNTISMEQLSSSTTSVEQSTEATAIKHNSVELNVCNNEDMAIKSILKPQSVSLEPRDKRARTKSNTPRKVQFTV